MLRSHAQRATARLLAAAAAPAAPAARLLATAAAAPERLERTALHGLHVQQGGRMVPFAGYELPVQYPDGVLKSHLHTRTEGCASLFDVGHMGQLKWFGKDRAAFLERVCLADVQGMAPGASALTLITLPTGGILDDSIISNHSHWGYQCVCGSPVLKRPAQQHNGP